MAGIIFVARIIRPCPDWDTHAVLVNTDWGVKGQETDMGDG